MKKLLISLMLILAFGALSIASAQDDVIEIDFIHIFSDDLRPGVIQEIVDEFQAQNPGIIVNAYSTNSDSDYGEVFNSALDNADLGDAPSVVQVEERLTQQAIDFGYFVPISDYASEEQLASLDDLIPNVRAFYQLDDQFWGMPWNVSNPILYYNKDMFTAAGLDPEQPPQTFDEILTACEALVAANTELAACVNWPMATWLPEQWVSMQNAIVLNNDNGRDGRATETLYNNEAMLNVVSWWDELDANGYYTYTGRVGDDNGEGIAFLTGRTAIHMNSTAGLTLFQNFAQFELGVSALPLPDESATNGLTLGGGSLWVMADQTEEQIQASVDFVFFLTDTANDMKWHKGTGYIPVRNSSIEALEEEGYYEENPFFRVAVDQMLNSESNVATAGSIMGPAQVVRDELIGAFQQIIDGEADTPEELESILSSAKERADAELQEYNSFFE